GGVVGELLLAVVAQAQPFRVDAEVLVPGAALAAPVREPLVVFRRRNEELHLGLLELARPEHEVSGRDLVAERLPDLRDAERRLEARGLEDVLEVEEDPLRRLGPQVRDRRVALDRSDMRLEHQVEGARLRQLSPALARALARLLGTARVREV